jgi:tRNA pseudouridine38-40 synthase
VPRHSGRGVLRHNARDVLTPLRGGIATKMRMLKLTIAYDGAGYVGWQRQAEGTSIQAVLEAAIARVEGHEVTVTGAGRTDAGVHALGQVASVRVTSTIACESYVRALNVALPDDIRVRRVDEMPEDFHARFRVRDKTYRYRLLNAPIASPFDVRYAWHVSFPLDLDAMRAALARSVGTHDFAVFQGTGSTVSHTVRTIHRAGIASASSHHSPASDRHSSHDSALLLPDDADARLLTIEMTGDGFLRHMVRNIVGTLVEVGRGRWRPDELDRLLASRDRTQAGPTAPPQGLFLVKVAYAGDQGSDLRPPAWRTTS